MYYYLLTIIEPVRKEYIRDLAHMMEISGNTHIAARKYNLYLALVPDAEDRDDVLAFLKSRERELEPAENCAENMDSDLCKKNKKCYWNVKADKCFGITASCAIYEESDECSSVPGKKSCYWNIGMDKCVNYDRDCFFYDDKRSCDSAPYAMGCKWFGELCTNYKPSYDDMPDIPKFEVPDIPMPSPPVYTPY